jgi:murein L,D-transpeptidase YafK
MYRLLLFLMIFLLAGGIKAQSFRSEQKKASRVKTAYTEKWEGLRKDLIKKEINAESFEMYVRVFKQEEKFEVWTKNKGAGSFTLFKTYPICESSGTLGPKRKQGDGQVPEGFYSIQSFNPYSSYHLSLGVSYPNASDRIVGKSNLGGDIMIHGNCVTIGCIPLTDAYIKEVYVLAVEARNGGQASIPVHIFPCRLDQKGMDFLKDEFEGKTALLDFWSNLKSGYDHFEEYHTLPKIRVDKEGKYLVGN